MLITPYLSPVSASIVASNTPVLDTKTGYIGTRSQVEPEKFYDSYKPSNTSSLIDYDKIKSIFTDLMELNSAGALAESERNRAFQQESADKAMAFEAQQAALDRLFQQTSAEKAMEFSRTESQAQRDFEERLANTAYQRAMADLKAAGLNPILAYAHPANVPSGVAAKSSTASGSRASGRSASGSQARVDSASDILSAFLTGTASMIGSAGKLISAFHPITNVRNYF